jgi:signal transduction histidine kinase
MLKFFKNRSVNQLNFLGVIFSAIFISIFISLAIYKEYQALKSDLIEIESEYIKSQKELLLLQSTKISEFLKYKFENQKEISLEEIKYLKLYEKSEIDIYTIDGFRLFGSQNINIEAIKSDSFNSDESQISYIKMDKNLNIIIKTSIHIDSINDVLSKKRESYQDRINNFIFQTLFFSIIILFLAMMLSSSISKLISKEIGLFMVFFKKASDSYEYIDKEHFSFVEFQNISNFANDMIKDIKTKDTELNELNQKLKYLVDEKTKKLRDKNKELQKSKDFTEKLLVMQDKFIKNSIHEINTPLSIILTNIDLLALKGERNRHLSKIEAGVKIIQNIYNDLSYIVKKDRVVYPKEKINFSTFLKSRVEFFNEIAKGNLLLFEISIADDIYLLFSEIELQRLIDNNIANAIKYSFENSKICISLQRVLDKVLFEITNQSNNIKEPQKIFDRFYRENDSRGGFGIGLNIVKNICDKNSVEIILSSKEREVTFKYSFKVSNEYINS